MMQRSLKGYRVALVVLGVVSCWGVCSSWFLSLKVERLRGELADVRTCWRVEKTYVRNALDRLDERALPADGPDIRSGSPEEQIAQAIDALGSTNILDRYQAGMTLYGFGPEAVPHLLELLDGSHPDAEKAALLILSKIDGAEQHAHALRSLASSASQQGRTDGVVSEDSARRLAGLLGLLGRCRDRDSVALFQENLTHDHDAVRVAAITGLERVGAAEAFPELAARLDKENGLAQRALQRAVTSLCKDAPGEVVADIPTLPPKTRYHVARILAETPSPAGHAVLEHLAQDPDPAVAKAAAQFLTRTHLNSPGKPRSQENGHRPAEYGVLEDVAREMEHLFAEDR